MKLRPHLLLPFAAVMLAELELRGEVAVMTACALRFIGTNATPEASVTAAPPPL